MQKKYLYLICKNLIVLLFLYFGTIMGAIFTVIFLLNVSQPRYQAQQFTTESVHRRITFIPSQINISQRKIFQTKLNFEKRIVGNFKLIFNYDSEKLSFLNAQFADSIKNPHMAKDLKKSAFLVSGTIKKELNTGSDLIFLTFQPIANGIYEINLDCLNSSLNDQNIMSSDVCPLNLVVTNKTITPSSDNDKCDNLAVLPPSITGVNQNNKSSGIDLKWQTDQPDQGVSIYYRLFDSNDWNVIPHIYDKHVLTISNLLPNKKYYIKMNANNKCIQSTFSNVYLISVDNSDDKKIILSNIDHTDSDQDGVSIYKVIQNMIAIRGIDRTFSVLIISILILGSTGVWLMNDFLNNNIYSYQDE